MKSNRYGKASIFSVKHYLKLLSVYANKKHKLALQIAFYTGERWGAIRQLKVEDVYKNGATTGFITFRKNTRKSCGGIQTTRQMQSSIELLKILREYEPDGEWLFPSARSPNQPITFRCLDLYFRKMLGRAGLEHCGYSTHSTRRTFITTLYRKGVPLLELQKITGHKSIKSLIEYIDIDPKVIGKIIDNYSFEDLVS